MLWIGIYHAATAHVRCGHEKYTARHCTWFLPRNDSWADKMYFSITWASIVSGLSSSVRNLLTAQSRVIFEKLVVTQLTKKHFCSQVARRFTAPFVASCQSGPAYTLTSHLTKIIFYITRLLRLASQVGSVWISHAPHALHVPSGPHSIIPILMVLFSILLPTPLPYHCPQRTVFQYPHIQNIYLSDTSSGVLYDT
jgi:hypothetical protein